jgi:16S rRNA (cytosine1407-C5)-methyltransferase
MMESESQVGVETLTTIEAQLPQLFVERLQTLLADDHYASSIQSFCEGKPVTIRPNTLKVTEEDFLQQVHDAGFKTKPVSWCPLCHLLTKGTIRQIQELPLSDSGGMYIQSASSMLAAHAMHVEPEMRVLDMCAAPGSKTTQIAAMMKNQGMLVANDRSRKRLYRLREILQRQGATKVEVLCGPGEQLGQTHADCFDRVLVDAPCSGEGRFRMDRPIRLSRWSLQEVRALSKLQEQLLIAAMRCVCVGGLVVYSTCTFSPEENEGVLDKVLSRNSIDGEIVQIPKNFHPPSAIQPTKTWNGVEFKNNLSNAIRIIPNQSTTGFFIACIKRLS